MLIFTFQTWTLAQASLSHLRETFLNFVLSSEVVVAASSVAWAASYLARLLLCCCVIHVEVVRSLFLLKPHSGADCGAAAGTGWAAAESRVAKRPPVFQAQPGLGILSTFLLRKLLLLYSHNFLIRFLCVVLLLLS